MKVATVQHKGYVGTAVEWEGEWLNFTAAYAHYAAKQRAEVVLTPPSLLNMLVSGRFNRAFFLEVMQEAVESSDRRELVLHADSLIWALPLLPGKIIGIGRNYAAHARETGHVPPSTPIVFLKAPSACIAPGEAIEIQQHYGRVDHEGELAVIVGRMARRVPLSDAMAYVAGFTILNDVTARDWQKADTEAGHPWARCKGADTFCPMGPAIMFPEDLPTPLELDVEVTVNGQLRQRGNTRDFLFDIPSLIHYVSGVMTLEPGDVIATGTPEGIGPIHPGDDVAVTIPPIGVLRNPVVAA